MTDKQMRPIPIPAETQAKLDAATTEAEIREAVKPTQEELDQAFKHLTGPMDMLETQMGGWTIEDGKLCFGENIHDATGHVRAWHFEENYGTSLPLIAVSSDDDKCCAVWRHNDLGHMDVFALEPSKRVNGGPLVDWPVYKFTTKHNRYKKTANYVAKFVKHEGVTYFLTCQKHGCLHLLDMQGQVKFHYNLQDYFIDYLISVNDKYVLLLGWAWTPFYSAILLPLEKFFQASSENEHFHVWYEGEKVDTNTLARLIDDEKSRSNVCEWIAFYRKATASEEEEDKKAL